MSKKVKILKKLHAVTIGDLANMNIEGDLLPSADLLAAEDGVEDLLLRISPVVDQGFHQEFLIYGICKADLLDLSDMFLSLAREKKD